MVAMLKLRTKRRANEYSRAVKRLASMEAEIVGLQDEDLLDLADIFRDRFEGPMAQTAQAEMTRRGISL